MIYTFKNNTYIATIKDDSRDRIQVEVGDFKQTDKFYPQVKIVRWDNEVNFSARLVTNESATVSIQADKIIWQGEKTEAHFYDIAPNEEHPEGAYEFEVILKEKSLTNKIEFTLEDKGVSYFYQPELTQQEIDEGAHRPENVVGSYAVYALENKINYVGGKEYKCGKIGHIYRPKITDSVGTEVWGELNIADGVLSVTIPQDFLDNAVYPVRHAAGLTFGYTSAGASEEAFFNPDNGWAIKAAPASSGSATKITAWCKNGTGSYIGYIKGVLWSTADKTIITNGVGGVSAEIAAASMTEYDSTFGTSPSVVGSTNYWVGLVDGAGGGGSSDLIAYDTGSAGDGHRDYVNSYTTPVTLDLISGQDVSVRYSIYCTYEAGATTSTSTTISTSTSSTTTSSSTSTTQSTSTTKSTSTSQSTSTSSTTTSSSTSTTKSTSTTQSISTSTTTTLPPWNNGGRLWSCGFELNSLTEGVEFQLDPFYPPTIQSSIVHSGTYALQILNLSSGNVTEIYHQFSSSNSNGPYFVRFYLRIGTRPSAENTIFEILGAPGYVYITLDENGALRLASDDGYIGSASSSLVLDIWYRVEVKVDLTGGSGSHIISARINGSEFASTTTGSINSGFKSIWFGGNIFFEEQTQGNWYFDDIAINTNTGSFQNSWPGEGSIVHLKPDSTGDNDEWMPSGAEYNWDCVNEVTPDDATTYVATAIANKTDDHDIEDTPFAIDIYATINIVHVGVRYNGEGASANSSFVTRCKKDVAGTILESDTITPANATWVTNANSTPRNYSLTLYQDPDSSNWTKATLDTAQIGVRLSSADTNDAQVSTLWALVEYVPSGITTSTSTTLSTTSSTSTSSTTTSSSTTQSISSSTTQSTSTSSTTTSSSTSTTKSTSTSSTTTSSSISTTVSTSTSSTTTSSSTSTTRSTSTSTTKSTSTSSTTTSSSSSTTQSTSTSLTTSTSLSTSTSSTTTSSSTSTTKSTSTSSTTTSTSISTSTTQSTSTSSSTTQSTSTSSTTTSSSTSTTRSTSSSTSITQSTSTSISTSTTTTILPPDKDYSMEANVSLPNDNTNLDTAFTYQQYLDVATADDIRVEQCSTGGFTIQQFKNKNTNNTDFINVSWEGQTSRAPSLSIVYLQIYNLNSTTWENVDFDNSTGDNTDFSLLGSITANVENYYDGSYWVSFRVYQEAV